jgi:RNase P/RNase MRP subunit p29
MKLLLLDLEIDQYVKEEKSEVLYDLVSYNIEVYKSKNVYQIGLKGVCVFESKNMLYLNIKNKLKQFEKVSCIFRVILNKKILLIRGGFINYKIYTRKTVLL